MLTLGPRLALTLAALLSVAAIALASPRDAQAHAAFVGATPQPGARLEVAPAEVSLRFTEPLNLRLTSIKLTAIATGTRVAIATRPEGRSRLIVRPGSLATGAYRVEWHTVSTEDGHALEGSFSFGVRAAAAGGQHTVEQSPFARDGWLRIVLRAWLYSASLLFVAALVLPRLMRAGASWLVPQALVDDALVADRRRRERALTEAVGWLAAAGAVAATLAEAADAAGSFAPSALRDFLLANGAGVARVGVVVLIAAAAALWRRFPRIGLASGVLALGAIAASGHASSASPRVPSVLNDWLHLVSAAAWLGGIGLVALVWAMPARRYGAVLRRDVVRHVLVPFGRVALPAFAVVSTTGLVSLLTQLGHLSALWQTDYGRVLAAKIVLVGAIAAASAVHALRWTRRLQSRTEGHGPERAERRRWRLVRVESVLGLGVVSLVALLVVFPLPPRQLDEAGQASAAASVCDPCPLPKPSADQLPVATGAGSHLVAGWITRTSIAVAGVIRVSDIRGRPARVPLEVVDAVQSSCGAGCWRFRAPPGPDDVSVVLRERGRRYTGVLPTRWRIDENQRASALLSSAERTMRGLRGVREVEEVTSGPGSYARTDYRVRAPDRMALQTDRGVQIVVFGKRQWFRASRGPWQSGDYGSGLAFRTRSRFRWTVYGRTVRLLSIEARGQRRVAELALFDESTPLWSRLTVDLATRRVLREEMTARAHFMRTRYSAFDQPQMIAVPDAK